ncbi:MAG: YjbQ family protein, partial [Hyphomicrobium sp.]
MSEATRTKAKGTLDQAFETLRVDTRGPSLSLLSEEVTGWLGEIGAIDGLLTLFIRHTSASLLIQENADPDVQTDLVLALDRLAPKGAPYLHTIEGDD